MKPASLFQGVMRPATPRGSIITSARADTTRKAIVLQNPSHIEQDVCRVVSP
jgi:hypothetical protein